MQAFAALVIGAGLGQLLTARLTGLGMAPATVTALAATPVVVAASALVLQPLLRRPR